MNINCYVCGIILNNDGEVLLIHRTDNDLWEIPGGALEEGETPWQAIVREVKEETMLDVSVEKLVSVGSRPKKHDFAFTFYCKIRGGKMHSTPEADKIEYFAFKDIPKNIAPTKLERIKDALEFNERCLLRDLNNSITTSEYILKNKL